MRKNVRVGMILLLGIAVAVAYSASRAVHLDAAPQGVISTTPAASGLPLGGSKVLPPPEPPFRGHIERNAKDSTPDFPKDVAPPAGAPMSS